jgi:hypothetical protein
LIEEVYNKTSVPVENQKIFYKAQELHHEPHRLLCDFDVENNSVLKLVGEPQKLRYSNYFGKINPGQPQQQQQFGGEDLNQIYGNGGGQQGYNPNYGFN